jgi:DNA modification methylase
VTTILLDYLTDAQKKAYVIADNKLALNAGWDLDMLKIEIDELVNEDFNIDLLGFESTELKNILADKKEGLSDEDAIPEVGDNIKCKHGDTWTLGKHKLVCGDSTMVDDVAKLMGDDLADMIFTDPPYNVNYGGGRKPKTKPKAHGTILNDHMTPEEFDTFLEQTFSNFCAFLKPLGSVYVCHPDAKTEAKITFEREFAKVFQKSATIIWDKGHAGLGYQDYRASHEPILYGWKEGQGSHYWCGDKTKKTVWQFSKGDTSKYLHPTQKPVQLVEEAILNSSKGQDIILDLFLGSGSTLIAAEKTGRSCYGLELDPKYCDVVIQRWQDFTGEDAILEQDGTKYNEL